MKNFFSIFFKTIALIVAFIFSVGIAIADKPVSWQMYFQQAASPLMAELHSFHNFLLVIITAIVLFVIFLIAYVLFRFNAKSNPISSKFSHNLTIEVIWTVVPIIILIIIAIPSFRILKMTEFSPPTDLTIKVVGSQWFWTYSYPDHGNIEFDSYMIQDADLKLGQIRLLEVDNRVVVPQGKVIKFLITASDVLHSFAIPSLGIKMDAVPGRINQTWTKIDKKGVYYGQCSELCGVKHGFMPIAVEVVSVEEFEKWVASKIKTTSKNNQRDSVMLSHVQTN